MNRDPHSTLPRALRLWPGVVIVALQWLVRFVVPAVAPQAAVVGVVGGLAGGLLVVLWWLFLSRAPWTDRLLGIGLMIFALATTPSILHESVATAGMSMLFFMYAAPTLSLAFVAWAVTCGHFPALPRRLTMALAIAIGCIGWAFVRTGGITGDAASDFAWRWAPTPEERLLTQTAITQAPQTVPTPIDSTTTWPGFRGPDRNSVVVGSQLATDWQRSPPVELWRRPVGPGWSSFAVQGGRIYTQEQRGEQEVVSCYEAATGAPIWQHHDEIRFWESNAGAGPRATPTLSGSRVFTFGATGVLNALDAQTGASLWSKDVAADTDAEVPMWGFSGSPLVMGDVVIVAAEHLVAYDVETGARAWSHASHGAGYTSPQGMTIDGVEQIVLIDENGVLGIAPGDGALLWQHAWDGYPIIQPARTANGDLLINVSQSSGIRRLTVRRQPESAAGEWQVQEHWTSLGLKPYFSDFVVHEGHAYGFDGSILACIDLTDGSRVWKGGRFGHGQMIVLADRDALLVVSEQGELALVRATPDGFTELARWPALTSKTWNHPVLVDDLLLVRNGEEMVAFRLPMANRSAQH